MFNCQKVRIQEIWIHIAASLDTTCVILEKSSFCVSVFFNYKMESVLSSPRHFEDKQHTCKDKHIEAVTHINSAVPGKSQEHSRQVFSCTYCSYTTGHLGLSVHKAEFELTVFCSLHLEGFKIWKYDQIWAVTEEKASDKENLSLRLGPARQYEQ